MDVTPEQLRILKAADGLRKLGAPTSDGFRREASQLVADGLLVENAEGDLVIDDEVKYRLQAAGHIF